MKNIIKNLTASMTAAALTFCFAAATVPAQQMMNTKETKKQQKEGRGEAREAAKVFREIMNVPDKGIPRELLGLALRDRRSVMTARRIDSCLLCRRARVNESGLCESCWSLLSEEELRLGLRWLSGEGP